MSDRKGDPTDPDNFLKYGEYPQPYHIPRAELGEVTLKDGSRTNEGRAMVKGTWNAALHAPLAAVYEDGIKASRLDF